MNVGYLLKSKDKTIYSIGINATLTEAVTLMMAQRIGSLAVIEGDRLSSIVTERDVMRAVNEHPSDFATLRVRDVMASKLICCRAEDRVDDAMELMFNNELGRRIRHLPVRDGERLVGIISVGDIVQALLTQTRFENKLLRNYIKNWPDAEEA